jgi:isopentenyl-diphosphate Delta-isomerase
MTTVGGSMIIDVVDQADTPVGVIPRAEVFQKHANFRVSHVFIFNSRGELLLQRLALSRRRNPGAWGSSVASYLFSSEDYLQAAQRRVRQELGISDFQLVPLGKTEMVDDRCLKFISLFQSLNEGPFQCDPSHIDRVEFVAIAEIQRMIESGSRVFTPTFLHVFQFYRSIRPAD